VLDALEQALYARTGTQGLIHHRDRGSQYLSIRYTERLAEVGIESLVGRGRISVRSVNSQWKLREWTFRRPL
jgi:transposase InsO family protein